MKKNKFLIFATAGALLLIAACSKNDILEEETLESPPATMATETTSISSFKLGANGHPLGPISYTSVSAVDQMNLLKKLGMSTYRFDVLCRRDNGKVQTDVRLYDALIKAAKDANVILLPMLYPRDLELTLSRTEAYARGRTLAKKFAANYKDDFDYYNIGNELDTKCLLSPLYSGTKPSHYDAKKFAVISYYLHGMHDGIKEQDPTAKTVINTTWMHYEYLKMLERDGVKFDIVGYQWYDDHERLAVTNHNITDITKFLSSKFNKPIWFTEVGFRNRDGKKSQADQKAFFDSFTKKCRANPQVKTAMIYELFNEPEKQHPIESHYGIINWVTPYSQYKATLYANPITY